MSSSDGFSLAKTLIRTCARTMFNTRQILVIDALFTHGVLHADDLAVLFSSQAKDIRRFVQPLLTAGMISKQGRSEAKIGSVRGTTREYYFIPLHPAIDTIKYKITRLRKKATQLYEVDEERKDWKCPRCKAEWTELEVLDKVGPDGFECHRCGNVLEFNEDAGDGEDGKYKHEKLKRLNQQLEIFDALIEKIDKVKVPENRFEDAWEGKVDVPRLKGSGLMRSEHMYIGRPAFVKGEGPGETDASRLQINISSGADQEREEEERREARRKELARQNQLPEWHTTIAGVKNEAQVKAEASSSTGRLTNGGVATSSNLGLKKDEGAESKNAGPTIEDEMQAYLEEMRQEKEEAERLAALEDAEDQDDEDDGELFEEVPTPSVVDTPMGSQSMSTDRLAPPPINGVKRNSDYDESGPSSEANTPIAGMATPERGRKRVKLEDGDVSIRGGQQPTKEPEDSEEDEDFEDAI
jgi:transcription initiation factor TFIIE subunit alpha